MNKKGQLAIFTLIGLLVCIAVGVGIYKTYELSHSDFLKEKATEYCESEGKSFDGIRWELKPVFFCTGDERNRESQKYLFLESELNEWRRTK